MSYNSSCTINVTNNTGGNAIITLSHQYSDDSPQVSQSVTIANGGTASSLLVAGFNTGFLRTGQDYWWIGAQVLDGPNAGYYSCEGSADDPSKECLLESDDNGTTATFTVSTETFLMALLSGSCTTDMDPLSSAFAANAKRSKKLSSAK